MAGRTEDDERVAVAIARELEEAALTARDVNRLSLLDREEGELPEPILGVELTTALRNAGIQVSAVGVDDAQDQVTVFLSKALPARLRQELPDAWGEVKIGYQTQRFQPINPNKVGAPTPFARRGLPVADPIRCGSSISLGNARAAGTFGALLSIKDEDAIFGLTCNHVTGGCNIVPTGVPVVHPGVLDVDEQTRRIELIGFQDRVLPIRQGQISVLDTDENDDVALFRIRDQALVSSLQGRDVDTPTKAQAPKAGLKVRKAGRTTDVTTGLIREQMPHALDYNFQVPVNAATVKTFQGVCNYRGVWRIEGIGDDFAKRGDSGALVTAEDGSGAIGLLYAADQKSGDGYMLPLKPILSKLSARLVSGLNV